MTITGIDVIDPKTGKPRKGKWVNRVWIPEEKKVWHVPQSNECDPEFKGTMWGFKKK